ncbi:C4-dicarboxylate transport sensor protein DctB [Planctomycetes bacterium CA13]|uniref:histidine kinase n=1 Tax=Novipirellula herctigrandis TaxID=2527986 RepID=A0A5C5YND5_9BACT|nr:C4-dicarboxylate transport sensor protein DctB [Planctomycetes bacterium CA13]
MLRRRSIRTKLIAALSLLTTIVLLLAFSGFWGLYRYRRLANSISQRATEIPYANDLNRLSETLRDSNSRMNDLLHNGGMIDAGLLDNPLSEIERSRYLQTLLDLEVRIQLYEDIISVSSVEEESDLLIDAERQRRSLGEIQEMVQALEAFHRQPHSMDYARKSELSDRLDSLVDLTEEHLSLIHGGMAAFSHDVRGQYRTWISIAWVCTIVSVAMVVLLLWCFHSLVVKPFQTLLDGSRLVARGQLNHWIDLGTTDELNELAMAMNGMTQRFKKAYTKLKTVCSDLDRQVQERTREVIQNEQLASVGFLAAGVAHEINNPLATIAWSAEALESRVEDAIGMRVDSPNSVSLDDELINAMRMNLRRIQDEAFRCKGITERLLDFSRLGEVQRSQTDLTELVEEIVAMVRTVGKYRCKTIRTHSSQQVCAHVNSQEIRQVILNLITNALESVETEGAVDIEIDGNESGAIVVVKDNGCGMSEEVIKHLFEPFFTRRRDGTGTGLGLSITYRIVSQHGGSLIPHSEGEGRGAMMKLFLPVSSENEDYPTQSRHTLGWNHESAKAAA